MGCSLHISRNVEVVAAVILVSLHVLPLDQALDALLDHLRVGRELGGQDLGALRDQARVVDLLARLHYFHDSCIDDVLSVILDLVG